MNVELMREKFAERVNAAHGWTEPASVDACCELEARDFAVWKAAWECSTLTRQVQVSLPPFGTKRKAAMAIYSPPFSFMLGYVYDSKNDMVADQGGCGETNTVEGAVAVQIRGWGRIGYMPNAAALQDEIGAMVVDALNAYYATSVDAAPDLLAALQASTHILHTMPQGESCRCGQCNFVRLRDAAIAKATSV